MTDFKLQSFSLYDVSVTDSYCANAYQKEVDYLASFDVDRLLAGFRETAGLDTKGKSAYTGWENMLIGGHSVGHYAGAAANVIKSPDCDADKRKILMSILSDLLDGFIECQKALGTGFIFGAKVIDKKNVEIQFDNVEKNLTHIITQAWVPWYTMHKIIEGLLCAVEIPEFKARVLVILSGLTDWIYNRVSKWSEETHKTVLSIEYGGMNDCLYSYYIVSGNEKALYCAKQFDDEALFKKIASGAAGDNVLSGRHANTTIPKFIGAVNRYVVTGEKAFLEYAESFWKLVTSAHTYVNGGNSTWEHFGEDNNLYSKLSNCNCETCNSYNMLKLTKMLYILTGRYIYTDWYEHTFINSILSSQNPESGMTTYFQPMASGYFKVYSTPFDSFWCCTGTGMENFSKLGESFYYKFNDSLVINQYFSSVLNWKEKNVKVVQKSCIPNGRYTTFTFEGTYTGDLYFRLPDWLADKAEIILNGRYYEYKQSDRYAVVSGTFDSSTEIKITLPMKITAYNLPDQKDAYAFKYGPVVLCALLGEADGKTATNGVNVQVPEKALIEEKFIPSKTDIVTVKGMSVENFIKNINDYLVRSDDDELSFDLKNTDSNLHYVVHYSQYKKRYGLYFRFLDEKESKNFMEDKLSQGYINAHKLDTVQPGYGQYENDELHNMTEYGNGSGGQTYHGTSRFAKEGGSFSYRMIVDTKGTDLLVQFDPADNGKSIKIMAGSTVIYEEKHLDCKDVRGFHKVNISLPAAVLKNDVEMVNYQGKSYPAVMITVSGLDGERSAQICEFMYTLKHIES